MCDVATTVDLSAKGKVANADFRNAFHSSSFLKTYGSLEWPENFEYKWHFIRDHLFLKRKYKTNGKISLKTLNGNVNFVYHYFDNTYNAFVLIFPIGENKVTKTKVILT